MLQGVYKCCTRTTVSHWCIHVWSRRRLVESVHVTSHVPLFTVVASGVPPNSRMRSGNVWNRLPTTPACIWRISCRPLCHRVDTLCCSAFARHEYKSRVSTCFETECIMTLQGHPRSLILAPVESAFRTSYWSSIVTLVLSCRVSEILQLLHTESQLSIPHPYSNQNSGCSSWSRSMMLQFAESNNQS